MTSRALAKARITMCCFPFCFMPYSLKYLEISISIAPPPGTILDAFMHLLTIMMASLSDLSASWINCSAPPLKTMVAVLLLGQSMNMLNLSAPICFSSKAPQVPRTSSVRPLTVVWTIPPVALYNLCISSWGTLPAQKIPLSAKYWVAKSPMGSLDNTIRAPESLI